MHRKSCSRLHPRQIFQYIILFAVLWISVAVLWSYFTWNQPVVTGNVKAFNQPTAEVQRLLDYISHNLKVTYRVVRNEEKSFLAELKLENAGNRTIDPCCWTIIFYHFNILDAVNFRKVQDSYHLRFIHDDTLKQPPGLSFSIRHINGNTYRLDVADGFTRIRPGEARTIILTGNRWIVSRSQILPNWYVVSIDPSTVPRLLWSTVDDDLGFVLPFDTPEKTSRSSNDILRPFTPEQRFEKNKVKDLGHAPREIIPTPATEKLQPKELRVDTESWSILYSKELKNEATYLKEHLRVESAEEITELPVSLSKCFLLKLLDSAEQKLSPEEYKLTVDTDKEHVTIVGATSTGVFYGVVSAVSLAKPVSASEFLLSRVELVDGPRFEHRGLMVDVARNFQEKEELMRVIDVLAMYKMNKLHLHLTDDEGWRLEIPGLEQLTQFGSRRGYDLKEDGHLMSMLGSGPFTNSSGSGFYSTADYRQILQHARSRHVEVIPEFDMPGHSSAAIKSMEYRHRQLKAEGYEQQARDYLLSDKDDTSLYLSAQDFIGGVINPCLESSYRFVQHVVSEVVKLHKDILPLKRFHFGGDEVPFGVYVDSPACKKYLQSHTALSGPGALKAHFIREVSAIVAHHGLEVQGWEDAFSDSSGKLIPLSEMKSKTVISQAWYNIWERNLSRRAYEYANEGYKVILTPATVVYFDNPQEPDPEDWGLHWATRYIDIKRTFFFAPESLYDNIDYDYWGSRISKQKMCGSQILCPKLTKRENIIGMEAAVWSEVIRTSDRLESMLWPRLLAVAERSWNKANWEALEVDCDDLERCPRLKERRAAQILSWTIFANTVGYKELKRLEALGIKYYLPRPGARVTGGRLEVNTLFPGLVVQTSVDGGATWKDYDSSSAYEGTILLATRSYDGKRRSVPVEIKVT